MSRLVVVSNRLSDPRKAASGGLAVALGETLKKTGGLWFGWSGNVVPDGTPGEGELNVHQAGAVTLATLDLCQEDHDAYYLGYSNGVLWPVFHYRLDLARFEQGHLGGYRRVNQLFARKLLPLLKEDDVIWIHDYHLIPLAAELRAMGCRNRIGFFLHIPLPPRQLLAAIPSHEWLMRALFSYDLVGFQSNADLENFSNYVKAEASAEATEGNRFHAFNSTVQAGVFPIGIDVNDFLRMGRAKEARDAFERTREEYSRRRLLIGVDRLDYSKGCRSGCGPSGNCWCNIRKTATAPRCCRWQLPAARISMPMPTSSTNWKACAAPSTAITVILTGFRYATSTATSPAGGYRACTAPAPLR